MTTLNNRNVSPSPRRYVASRANRNVSPLSSRDEGSEQKGFFNRTRKGGKSVWDWLNFFATLLIPLVVVGATIGFGWWQGHLADVQHQRDQQLADVQHQQDQQIAQDQQRATILQTYIDNIQDLLLNHNLLKSKRNDPSNPYNDAAILARARTLTALEGLDPQRKARVVVFLYEAHLIGYFPNNTATPVKAIIDLHGADLHDATLGGYDLHGADLHGTFLADAGLSGDDLSGDDLSGAILSGADLYGADLYDANLSGALLYGADLYDANLNHADLSSAQNLTQQQLDHVSTCKGAILPNGLICHHNQ